MELKDLMELKALEGNSGMSPYEQFKTQHMQAKGHTSGIGVAGLVLGTVGTALAVGSWIFGPIYGNSRAKEAAAIGLGVKDLANAQYASALQLMNQQNANTNTTLDRLIATLNTERAERIAGDVTLTNTVNDSVSGSQQGSLTAQQAAELSAIQTATNTVTAGLMTGQYSQNPLRVVRVSGTRECPCDGGCGCNG